MNTFAQKHVEVVVAPDGSCTIDAMNFADASCTQATQQLIAALGGQVVANRLKPEAANRPHLANRIEEAAR
jgi:hypothetical protein